MKYIPTIKRKFDPKIWKDSAKAWNDMFNIFKDMHKMRIPFGASAEILCSPDPRNLAKAFLRRGRLLEKEDKQKYKINLNMIVGDIIFDYFTDKGLSKCLQHTLDLAYIIAMKVIKKPGESPKLPDHIPMPGK